MYAINGVPLDNPARGWTEMRDTQGKPQQDRELSGLQVAGRDGVVAGVGSTVRPSPLRLVVETPPAGEEALVALVGSSGVVSTAPWGMREAVYETVSVVPRELETATPRTSIEFRLRLPGAFWRAPADSTQTVALSAASVSLAVFPGLSAPVQDAVVRLQGQASGVQVTDSSGAWVTLPTATAGQWVRFESATGMCFRTTTDTWTGGTDVSGLVDFGGPRNVFEITPAVNLGDLSRAGQLAVASATRSGAVVAVRGKSAHAI